MQFFISNICEFVSGIARRQIAAAPTPTISLKRSHQFQLHICNFLYLRHSITPFTPKNLFIPHLGSLFYIYSCSIEHCFYNLYHFVLELGWQHSSRFIDWHLVFVVVKSTVWCNKYWKHSFIHICTYVKNFIDHMYVIYNISEKKRLS